MTEQRVLIPAAAARRAAKLMAARDMADRVASTFMEGLAAGLGIPLERVRGLDDATNELIVTVPDAPKETTDAAD